MPEVKLSLPASASCIIPSLESGPYEQFATQTKFSSSGYLRSTATFVPSISTDYC